jgi:hypothetical protein
MFQIKVVEKIQKTHIAFNNFFLSENRAVYDTMWKNVVDPERPKMLDI